jgi:hypothetical protein
MTLLRKIIRSVDADANPSFFRLRDSAITRRIVEKHGGGGQRLLEVRRTRLDSRTTRSRSRITLQTLMRSA